MGQGTRSSRGEASPPGPAQPGQLAYLIPIVPDLSVASSSLALLDAARRGERGGFFPWGGLIFGAITTMVMNLAAGWREGWDSSLVSLFAPVALVFSYETLMGMFQAAKRRASLEPVPAWGGDEH